MQLAPEKRSAKHSKSGSVEDVAAVAFQTGLGWMALAYQGDVLLGIVFGYPTRQAARDKLRRYLRDQHADLHVVIFVGEEDASLPIVKLVERLKVYAAGEEVDFSDVRIDDRHLTGFGRKIVNACRRIPRGTTRGYGELAAQCGSPGAARAVGQVMARNRFPLVVPCHRVLAAGGLLGGFSAPQGLSMKRRLLAIEQSAS